MNLGTLIMGVICAGLIVVVLRRGREPSMDALERWLEQFAYVIPQLAVALLTAGFLAKLIPGEWVAGYLGTEAGWWALVIGAVAGPVIPAGPILAFSIAAVFERAGATPEALVAFITSWSLFTLHRVITYEIPLLGFSFLRLRLLSVGLMPICAGLIAAGLLRLIG